MFVSFAYCFIFKIRGDSWAEARESDDLWMVFSVP